MDLFLFPKGKIVWDSARFAENTIYKWNFL